MQNSVITGIARTPIGKYNGSLAPMRAVELGGVAIARGCPALVVSTQPSSMKSFLAMCSKPERARSPQDRRQFGEDSP